MDYVESIDRLSSAGANLSKTEKEIVGLRMDGLTYREIAKSLKISITQAHQIFTSFCSKIKETLTGIKVPSYLLNKQKQLGFAGVN
jgi:DNA-directed RNA polymerase specialized sigma subunit